MQGAQRVDVPGAFLEVATGTMYRLCAAIDGKERIAEPYFTATSGDSPESRGRRRGGIARNGWRRNSWWHALPPTPRIEGSESYASDAAGAKVVAAKRPKMQQAGRRQGKKPSPKGKPGLTFETPMQ